MLTAPAYWFAVYFRVICGLLAFPPLPITPFPSSPVTAAVVCLIELKVRRHVLHAVG
jgi:hypothetical protein